MTGTEAAAFLGTAAIIGGVCLHVFVWWGQSAPVADEPLTAPDEPRPAPARRGRPGLQWSNLVNVFNVRAPERTIAALFGTCVLVLSMILITDRFFRAPGPRSDGLVRLRVMKNGEPVPEGFRIRVQGFNDIFVNSPGETLIPFEGRATGFLLFDPKGDKVGGGQIMSAGQLQVIF